MQYIKGYLIGFHLYSWIGQHYLLGAEPEQPIGKQPEILLSDCSGAQAEALKRAGANLIDLFGTNRPTAQGIYNHCDHIAYPSDWRDYIFHRNSSGHITHGIKYIPPASTIQSGDGTGHVAKHTLEWDLRRSGVVCGRLRNIDIDATPIMNDLQPIVPASWLNLNMKRGYVGYHNRLLHSLLNQIQASGLSIADTLDGNSWGPKTDKAMIQFQTNHHIPITKKVDSATLTALIDALGL